VDDEYIWVGDLLVWRGYLIGSWGIVPLPGDEPVFAIRILFPS